MLFPCIERKYLNEKSKVKRGCGTKYIQGSTKCFQTNSVFP